MPITPSSNKEKLSFKELMERASFKEQAVAYKPTKELIKRLLKKNGLFGFNIDLVLEEAIKQDCRDDEETEGFIEEIAYKESRRCTYCDDRGCRICLGIDL